MSFSPFRARAARFLRFLAAAFVLAPAGPAHADLIPAEIFAQLPRVRQVQFSPDASWIAYTSPIEGRINLVIAPMDPSAKAEAIPPVADADISWFRWINNERLVVSYRYTNEIGSSYARTALFSVHRSEPGYVDMAPEPKERDRNPYARQRPQLRDRVIDYLPDDPDHFLLAIDSDMDGRSEVRRVDVATGRFKNITEGYDWIRTWKTDQDHEYRLGWGIGPKGLRVLYINPENNRAHELSDVSWFEDRDIRPLAFTADPHIAYALEPATGSRDRLVTFNILEGKVVDILFEHPAVDVDGPIFHPETGALAGVQYTDDLPRVEYFDPALKALKAQLDEWLPGGSNSIETMNSAKGLYIVNHITDREDTLYLLDMKNGGAKPFARNVPVPVNLLAATERHDIPARDGLPVPTYLTLPQGKERSKLPMVVLPHGGPAGRDTMVYNYWAQFLANRGYAVLRPNFRGSDGFGRQFKTAGENQWGGQMQDDVTDATRWAIDQGIADPDRICIAGGSYGGYAALMGAVKEPSLYKCAVSINGVADLPDMITREENLFGLKQFTDTIGLEGERIKAVSPYHQADRIRVPVLIVHAKDDPVVPFEQGKSMYKKLKQLRKPVEMVTIESGDHHLDTQAARLAFLKPLETFLARAIGRR